MTKYIVNEEQLECLESIGLVQRKDELDIDGVKVIGLEDYARTKI